VALLRASSITGRTQNSGRRSLPLVDWLDFMFTIASRWRKTSIAQHMGNSKVNAAAILPTNRPVWSAFWLMGPGVRGNTVTVRSCRSHLNHTFALLPPACSSMTADNPGCGASLNESLAQLVEETKCIGEF
jgi:hypothetical protein